MSIERCEDCERQIDTGDDLDCYVEVGNMRRLHKTKVMCEPCRDKYFDGLDADCVGADPTTGELGA